jgi:hypothetical protein
MRMADSARSLRPIQTISKTRPRIRPTTGAGTAAQTRCTRTKATLGRRLFTTGTATRAPTQVMRIKATLGPARYTTITETPGAIRGTSPSATPLHLRPRRTIMAATAAATTTPGQRRNAGAALRRTRRTLQSRRTKATTTRIANEAGLSGMFYVGTAATGCPRSAASEGFDFARRISEVAAPPGFTRPDSRWRLSPT